MATLDILVAEDEPLNAMALESQLQALGHRVIGPAGTGREAVELARTHTMDLAILDIRMPGGSGLEAAEEIFRARPTPIILLTGYSDPEAVERLAGAPVFHYLVKPVSLEELAPAIGVARRRFQEWEMLKGEAEALEGKLTERKLVERAKGVVMETRGLSAEEAERLLERRSREQGTTLGEVARTILAAEALLRGP